MVAHTCNLSTQEAEAGEWEFKASLGYNYIASPCPKEKERRKGGRKKENPEILLEAHADLPAPQG
jgi:hypothetical protein